MKEDENKNALIKKADSVSKFNPQKKKELIVRGLKEVIPQKTVLLVFNKSNKHLRLLVDKEIIGEYGNKINVVHSFSPLDAFNYLIANNVDLIISELLFEDRDGIQLLNACKTLYPRLPFIVYCAYDYHEGMFRNQAPDIYIQISSDLSELISTVGKLLNSCFSTENYNFKIKAGDSDTLYNAGKANYLLGKYETALELFNNTIIRNPNDANVHIYIGCCYERLGMFEKAIEADLQALKIKPEYALAYHNLGVHYCQLNKYTEAIDAFKHALELEPDDADPYLGLGFVYSKLGMHREAIEVYNQALKIKPDSANTYFGLGLSYYELNMYTESIEAYKQALEIKPDDPNSHCNLGLAYIISGQKSKALEEYQILKKLDSEMAEKLFNEIYK